MLALGAASTVYVALPLSLALALGALGCSAVFAIAYRLLGMAAPDFTLTRSVVPPAALVRRTRVGSFDFGSMSIAFEWWIGASRRTMPPSLVCDARTCLVMMFTPSIVTRPVLGWVRSTVPRLPLSSPEITCTVSPLVRCSFCRTTGFWRTRFAFRWTSGFMLEYLRRERHDLHVSLVAQFTRHGAEDACGPGLALVVNQDRGVLVEPDVGAVLAAGLLGGPDDDRLGDIALLH